MSLGSNDLIVTNPSGVAFGYVIDMAAEQPLLHNATAPNVNNNSAASNPAQAGGVYDVRDSEGDKTIAHVDWSLGAGQLSLDAETALAGRFHESNSIDISQQGSIRLLRPITYTETLNFSGPIFAALGLLWMGTANGGVKYTSDKGANWTSVTITASPAINAPVSGFTTDGTYVYFSVPTGANPGVWKVTYGAPYTAAKLGSTPGTEAIRHLAYSGGFLFGSTAAGAGTFDSTTGVYTQGTAAFLNVTNTSVGLVAAGNAVYWTVSQGGRSYVYQLSFDPNSQAVATEQFAEFPTGFVATCSVGYLSQVYTGGYFDSATSNVGRGAVYISATNRSNSAPLVEIGTQPEYTASPSDVTNDNRVYAMCAAGKDLYILTNRAVYRWDIDQGGYSHAFDFMGSGYGTQTVTWNAGSNFSWDGTDLTSADPPHGRFPTGFTPTVNGAGVNVGAYDPPYPSSGVTTEGTASWSHAGGIAVLTNSVTTEKSFIRTIITGAPSGGEALSNTTGTTLELAMGSACKGRCLVIEVGDGVRALKALYMNTTASSGSTGTVLRLYKYVSGAWEKASDLTAAVGAHTIRFTLKGLIATAAIDGGTEATTTQTKADTSADYITLTMSAGTGHATYGESWFRDVDALTILGGVATNSRVCAIDSIGLNSAAAVPTGNEIEVLSHAGIAYSKGNLMAPYAVGTDAASYTITSSSVANPTVITTSDAATLAAGGLATGQVVNIASHSGSTPALSGLYVATLTGDHTFTIPVNVSVGGTGGTAAWNQSVGFAVTGTGYASSGSLTQSFTTFHSGSVLKDFRYMDITHEPLPAGSALTGFWTIDGEAGSAVGVTTGTTTRFTINAQGYGIQPGLGMTRDTSTLYTPIIHGSNVVWNFVKVQRHQYALNCAAGAGDGRWQYDAEDAIAHLFSSASQRCTFEDRFNGSYTGAIDSVELTRANYTPHEGVSGTVRLIVREE